MKIKKVLTICCKIKCFCHMQFKQPLLWPEKKLFTIWLNISKKNKIQKSHLYILLLCFITYLLIYAFVVNNYFLTNIICEIRHNVSYMLIHSLVCILYNLYVQTISIFRKAFATDSKAWRWRRQRQEMIALLDSRR